MKGGGDDLFNGSFSRGCRSSIGLNSNKFMVGEMKGEGDVSIF